MFFELCGMHHKGMINGKYLFRRLIIRRVFPVLLMDDPAETNPQDKEAGNDTE